MKQETGPTTLVTAPVRYRLRQTFTYEYDGPVTDLLHRLVVLPPPVHGDQRLRSGEVTVDDPAADVRWHSDAFGNRHCVISVAQVTERLHLQVDVEVERAPEAPAGVSVPRQRSRERVLRRPSLLTVPDAAITALAQEHRVAGDRLATADAFCALVQERIVYGFDATHVGTTAAEALAVGTGVCQDQAHLMLALCRSVGIPARYVSGHLVGQGGTHAWTEVLAEGTGGVVAFDPCHGRRTDDRYVTVAVGRDYADVPPTSGTYVGDAAGRLITSRVLDRLPIAA